MFHFFYLYHLTLGRKIWLLSSFHFKGPVADILRRFTWEGLQTFTGWWIGFLSILCYRVSNIQDFHGALVIQVPKNGYLWGGVTFGSVIIGDSRIDARLNNTLFMHEFGHVLQSRASGPLYLFKYGLPSLKSSTFAGHNLHPVEQDANRRSHRYFSQKSGYRGWPLHRFPIVRKDPVIKNYWWEYLPPLFPLLYLFQLLLPVRRVKGGRPH